MTHRPTIATAAALLLLAALPARAQERAAAPASSAASFMQALDVRIPQVMEELSIPGAAVAVIQDGRVVGMRAYGYADRERRIPVTEHTPFNVGSISKALTAWGVMRLVDQGRIELDAPVSRYLRRWQLPRSELDADGVTVGRVLSHTAGLSISGYRGWDSPDSVPTLVESLAGNTRGAGDVRLVMEPGSRWQYSGGGYTLLQLLVEDVTGRPFADYMRDEVLRPLGMTETSFARTPRIEAIAAQGYDNLGERMATPPLFVEQAAAGMYTTLQDLARFALVLLEDSAHGYRVSRRVLRPETFELMLRPAAGTDGGWGLGHTLIQLPDGNTRVGHGGGTRGSQSNVWAGRVPRDGIVVLTNAAEGWNVVNQVMAEWMAWKTGVPRPIRKSVHAALLGTLRAGGVAALEARYRELKATRAGEYLFDEGELNTIGYALLRKGRIADAVAVFELNVREYPDAWNPYDSLGDAYAAAGRREDALRSYRRSLELNPDNENARRMIAELGQN